MKRYPSDFLGSWINGNLSPCSNQCGIWLLTSSEVELMETSYTNAISSGQNLLLTSSEVELMETKLASCAVCIKNFQKTSDFLGSWINGNNSLNWFLQTISSSDFLGSWINGNRPTRRINNDSHKLLTSSEVELMETPGYWAWARNTIASDFLGSWINGNNCCQFSRAKIHVGFWLPRKLN